MNWVFATRSNVQIPKSVQPECKPYLKLRLFDLELIVWNIYDIGLQRYRDYKIRACGKDLSSIAFFWVGMYTQLTIYSIFISHKLFIKYNRLRRSNGPLYTTSHVSNITRKAKFSHISWHVFQDEIKKCKKRK